MVLTAQRAMNRGTVAVVLWVMMSVQRVQGKDKFRSWSPHARPRRSQEPWTPTRRLRAQASTTTNDGQVHGVCHQAGSFLGVGNVDCLHENLGTSIFLLGIIIFVSILFERAISFVRRAIVCPQLKMIVNRIFEELMIMGFISMIIFTLNTSGLMQRLHFEFDGNLSVADRLHFYEFFHYIVFLTMIYFIVIVLLLLFIGTVVPKFVWEAKDEDETSDSDDEDPTGWGDLVGDNRESKPRHDEDAHTMRVSEERMSRREFPSTTPTIQQNYRSTTMRLRTNSGMDLVQGSRAYALLLQRYQREGWCFRFNLKKQWHVWKSFEVLAYNICQNRSGYIYKNPGEMERLFGVTQRHHRDGRPKPITYDKYHVLCMRNLLFHISHLHFSAFFVLLAIAVLPVLYPDYDHWIFIGVGGVLLLVNLIIFVKVLQILKGIVDDRLRVITRQDIQRRMQRSMRGQFGEKKVRSLRVIALSIRAVIRMQMSALCHQQLHYHNHRFWFNSPRFLLRLFHFATIGQAFYLVWFSLVEWPTIASNQSGTYLIVIMVLMPLLALCVITPMTMPSLVLVMSLTGIFVDLNGKDPASGHRPTQTETKTRIRLLRRSFLRSHYTETEDYLPPPPASPSIEQPGSAPASPSAVFLRMYDSPTTAVHHGRLYSGMSPRPVVEGEVKTPADDRAFSDPPSVRSTTTDDIHDWTRSRHSFDLQAYRAAQHPSHTASRKASLDLGQFDAVSPRPPSAPSSAAPPASPAFKNYCSKYGGYPDME